MYRILVVLLAGAGCAALGSADDKAADPVRARLEKAKAARAAEVEKTERVLADALDKAEAAARKKGDKAAVDRLRHERVALELLGTVPKSLPAARPKSQPARDALEAAYAQVVRD